MRAADGGRAWAHAGVLLMLGVSLSGCSCGALRWHTDARACVASPSNVVVGTPRDAATPQEVHRRIDALLVRVTSDGACPEVIQALAAEPDADGYLVQEMYRLLWVSLEWTFHRGPRSPPGVRDRACHVRYAAARLTESLRERASIWTAPLFEIAFRDDCDLHSDWVKPIVLLGPKAVPFLVTRLEWEVPRPGRPLAFFILGRMGPMASAAKPALLRLLASPDTADAHAMSALASIAPHDPETRPAIEAIALGHPDALLREQAKAFLESLGPKN